MARPKKAITTPVSQSEMDRMTANAALKNDLTLALFSGTTVSVGINGSVYECRVTATGPAFVYGFLDGRGVSVELLVVSAPGEPAGDVPMEAKR